MFDSKSDYALNKLDQDAIVCKSATGVHIRLTREDFASDEEFQHWKEWSDCDYHDTEKAGRKFYDKCTALNTVLDSSGLSIEDILVAPLLRMEQSEQRTARIQMVRSVLTEKQYRRLRMYFIQGMTETRIAEIEGVGQRRISKSITSGIAALKKILKNF